MSSLPDNDGAAEQYSGESSPHRPIDSPYPSDGEDDETSTSSSYSESDTEPTYTTINFRPEGRGQDIVQDICFSGYSQDEQLHQLEQALHDPTLSENDRHVIRYARINIRIRRRSAET
ncbi:hypothetical protein NX059_001716 [Plenodomus lindquistii]|nr:hypothetical protein NX059_001716 [Plenodomus lindquistii]